MDARCVDRPAAVVRADPGPLTTVAVRELVARGYDVHLSGDLVADLGTHPRLHPVEPHDHEAAEALARSVRRRGGPLALVVCAPHHDVAEVCALLEQLRAPRPRAGVLVLRTRARRSVRRRPPVVAGATAPVIISTVDAGPRPLRAVRRGLDAVTAR